jgi:hypothetical protein
MTDDIRRHPNGCIDYDFYRAQAVALRRQAMRDIGPGLAGVGTAIMAGGLGFATVIPAAGFPGLAASRTTQFPRR